MQQFWTLELGNMTCQHAMDLPLFLDARWAVSFRVMLHAESKVHGNH